MNACEKCGTTEGVKTLMLWGAKDQMDLCLEHMEMAASSIIALVPVDTEKTWASDFRRRATP